MKSSKGLKNHGRLPIVYNPVSRRMFLRGAGSLLAIPFLPSLLPYAEAAIGDDMYFIFTMITHGRSELGWYPQDVPLNATPVAGVRSLKLANVGGSLGLGPTIRNNFNNSTVGDLRGKINLIQGLDFLGASNSHDIPVYTGGTRNVATNLPTVPWSIDAILAASSKVYPQAPAIRALRLNPMVGGKSFSYNGTTSREPAYGKTLKEVWDLVKVHVAPVVSQPAQANVDLAKRKLLIDRFFGEYRTLASSSQLSREDKELFQKSTDHLAQLQGKISASTGATQPTSPTTIPQPNVGETTSTDLFNERLIDIMVYAMACNITRVGTYAFNWDSCMSPTGPVGNYHDPGAHTAHGGSFVQYTDWWNHALKKYAHMVRRLGDYGILDKSFVMFTSEYSSSTSGHHGNDMPVLTAGSLNGRFVTGEWIDFRNTSAKIGTGVSRWQKQTGELVTANRTFARHPGRLINELFTSVFHAAGLSPAEYQKDGRQGFGEYTCNYQAANHCADGGYSIEDMIKWYASSYNQPKTATLPYLLKA